MAIVDLSNYDTILLQSTQGRAGTPDGNVYFDSVGGTIEYIAVEELATISYPVGHPSYTDGSPVANPLSQPDGIKFEAIYAFENQERSSSVVNGEALRAFDRWTDGTFKFGGAYNYINGRVPATVADRSITRGSGWNEKGIDGLIDLIYFGNKGLSNIFTGSQPYSQLGVHTTAVDFAKVGQIDEAILVYTDGGTNNTLDPEIVSVRTYGNNYDRKSTDIDLGISELGGYSTGFALNESVHLTTNTTDHPFVDVWTTPTGAWANMTLAELDTPVSIDEFNEVVGNFTWVINNPDNSTLDQCVAYLDAIATVATDINIHATNTTIGKDVDVWYSYNASGQIVTNSGSDTLGLYIYNIPTSDQQRIIFTADDGSTKSYAFSVSVEADVGSIAKADINAWYHSFFAGDYNTASAITVLDSSVVEVKGLASSSDVSNKIIFAFDYTGDTVGGGADTDKNCVFLCEGDGGATQAKTLYTITKNTTVAFSCSPSVENNV